MTDQAPGPRAGEAAPPARPAWWIGWWMLPPVLLVIGGSVGAGHDNGRPMLLVVPLAVAAGSTLLIAGPWPRVAVQLNGWAVAGYFAAGLDNGPVLVSVWLVAFIASQRVRPRPMLTVLAPSLALIVAGLGFRSTWYGVSATMTSWQIGGLIALTLWACVLGWWLTDWRAGRRAQAERTATEEQLRMAQDLHDGVGHGLAVISMHAAVALHVLDSVAGRSRDPDARLRQSLEVIRDTGRESLDALRVQLAAISTGAASRRPAPGLPELDDLLARVRAGGLAVTRHGDPGDVPEEIGQAVYAVVQESLTNVLRHARAARAGVSLARVGQELVVSIMDDGRGLESGGGADPAGNSGAATRAAGMGLPGMRTRVERLGGTLESGFTGKGFVVRAYLPVTS